MANRLNCAAGHPDNRIMRTPSTLGRTILVGALVAFLPLTLAFGALASALGSRTLSLLKGSTVVPAQSYSAWRISTEERKDGSSQVVGRLSAEGDRNGRVAVAILTEADFNNWRRGYSTTPLYVSGEVTRADVRVPLARPGVYYVVLSNLFSAGAPKTVSGSLDLVWSPGLSVTAPVSTVSREDYRRDLLSFGAVLVLAGILTVWSIQRPPGTETISSEKKIA